MAVPLGHKNHRTCRKVSSDSLFAKYIGDGSFYIDENNVLSTDKKQFICLNEELTGEFSIPEGVEVICSNALKKSKVDIINLPSSILLIKENAIKDFFYIDYELTLLEHNILDFCYKIKAKRLILRGRKAISDYKKQIINSTYPRPIQNFLLQRVSVHYLEHELDYLIDLNGVLYSLDGTSIVHQIPHEIRKFEIPSGVTSVEDYVSMSGITDIVIPSSLQVVDSYIFDNCYKLNTVKFLSSQPPIVHSIPAGQSISFHNCKNLKTIYVPIGSLQKYKSVLGDSITKAVEYTV